MLTSIKQRTDREDDGFTLIELMVVVLIIAILLAIAIPTFLGARNSANQRSAQSNLRNALTAEQTYWTNNQAFSADVTSTGMPSVESGISWVTVAPTAGNIVDVAVNSTGDGAVLAAFAKDGNCYYVEQSNNATASYTGYASMKQTSTGTCTAAVASSSTLAAPTVTTGADSHQVASLGVWATTW